MLRAERKAGEFLKNDNELGSGKNPKLGFLGIDDHQSSRWQLVAKVSEKSFDEWIEEVKETGSELTAAGSRQIPVVLLGHRVIEEPY